MIEPEIITSSPNNALKDRNVIIKDKFIEDYFKTSGYPQDIKTSYNRLCDYIMSRKRELKKMGKVVHNQDLIVSFLILFEERSKKTYNLIRENVFRNT